MLKNSQLIFTLVFGLLPLFGVLFRDWDARTIILLYWAENLIIGAWQIVKMLTVSNGTHLAIRVAPSLFFGFHYGFFCFVHGIFVLSMTGSGGMGGDPGFPLKAFVRAFSELPGWVGLALVSNIISHGIEVFRNYYANGNYKTAHIGKLMSEPYKHIFVVHIAIIAAGFLATAFKSAAPALLCLIVLGKLAIDLKKLFSSSNPPSSESGPSLH